MVLKKIFEKDLLGLAFHQKFENCQTIGNILWWL